jgi:23S rRNA (uridine2552-2'-O)-methyltransferase
MSSYKKPDHWALRAQQEGYPARSVYKLKELDEKFGLLRAGAQPLKVLDLGAAPGSWSLYALRKLGGRVFLAAADLAPLSRQYDRGLFDGENFLFVPGDLTGGEVRTALLARGPYRLVMSDAAPATTGNRPVDTLRSLVLAEAALEYAREGLEEGGNLVVKVFQGGDTAELLRRLREVFRTAKGYKPAPCRSESFETYYLGLDKRG